MIGGWFEPTNQRLDSYRVQQVKEMNIQKEKVKKEKTRERDKDKKTKKMKSFLLLLNCSHWMRCHAIWMAKMGSP